MTLNEMMSVCDIRNASEYTRSYKNLFNRLTDGDWCRYEYNDTLLEPPAPAPAQKYSYYVLKYTKNKKEKETLHLSKELLHPINPSSDTSFLTKIPKNLLTTAVKYSKYIKKAKHFHFNSLQKKFIMSHPFPKNNPEYFALCDKLTKIDIRRRLIKKENVWRFIKGQKYQRNLKKNKK
jgi:hypothetical protein